jgi:hypothetical protein
MMDRRLADRQGMPMFARNSTSHRVPLHYPGIAVDENAGVGRDAVDFANPTPNGVLPPSLRPRDLRQER